MSITISHYARMAESHRVKALYADSVHEQMHWETEAARFAQLAELESTDPAAARAAYRPTRAYNPDMPIVRHTPTGVEITLAPSRTGRFDPDRLATAWLVRLDCPDAHTLAVRLRDEHGFDVDTFRYAVAADALVRAGIDPTKEN
ncbi:hypothetical protein ACIODS_11960 [Micromonospora chalcea]|uniref:hypothetical protein n=1 Tax=Micromonospora chalcea TaxID=1874 RepID=UPI0037F56DFA